MTKSHHERDNEFKRLRDLCVAYVRKMCKFTDEATREDVVQDCMLESLKAVDYAKTDALHYVIWKRNVIDSVYRANKPEACECDDSWMRGASPNPEKEYEIAQAIDLIQDDRAKQYLIGESESLKEALGSIKTQDYLEIRTACEQVREMLGVGKLEDDEDEKDDQTTFDFI